MSGSPMESVCAAVSADDLLVFERSGDELQVVGGHGRGAGWAGIVSTNLRDEPQLAGLVGGHVVRVGGATPQHVIGPYWAAAATLVPVGDDHLVVFAGPRLARMSDGELLRYATEAIAAYGGVSADKLLADELEVVHTLRRLMEHHPESVTATARHIAEVAAEALSCDIGLVLLEHPDGPQVIVAGDIELTADDPQVAELIAIAEQTRGAPLLEQETAAGTSLGGVVLVSRLALRIGADGRGGMLLVGHARERPRGFTSLCQRIGRAVADAAQDLLGQAMAREALAAERDRFADAARTDALTGLGNRTAWNEALTRPPSGGRAAVIIADVNGLKRTNDTYGLAAGDALVVAAADLLRRSVRAEDVIARIGGDEFAILMHAPKPGDVAAVVDRLRTCCAVPISTGGAPDAGMIELRLAVGTAIAEDDEPIVEVQRRADEGMRADKRIGHAVLEGSLAD